MKYTISINDKKMDVDTAAAPSELLAQAKEQGIELTDAQLEQVSDGDWDAETKPSQFSILCNNCGGYELELNDEHFVQGYVVCPKCGTTYTL